MDEAKSDKLTTAYKLIEDERLGEAREILEPILDVDKDNADTWWLYAHAVEDMDTAQYALNNVARINPSYPGAETLSTQLKQRKLGKNYSTEDVDMDDFDLDRNQPDSRSVTKQQGILAKLPRWVLFVIPLILLLIILGLVLLSGGGDDESDGEDLSIAQNATDVDDVVTPTLAATPSSEEEGDILSVFSAFRLATESSEIVDDAQLGRVLTVSLCQNDGQNVQQTLDEAMSEFIKQTDLITNADAIGIKMTNCETDEVLNTISVDLESVYEFNDGTLDEAGFRSRWIALE